MGRQNLMRQQDLDGKKTLSARRQQIDVLDSELVRLLNQRAAIACEIAALKAISGLPAYDGDREQQVLDRIAKQNSGPFNQRSISAIFRAIIRETRLLEAQHMREQSGPKETGVQEFG